LRNDEALTIKNQPKHPKKGGIQGTKWKDPCPRGFLESMFLTTTMKCPQDFKYTSISISKEFLLSSKFMKKISIMIVSYA
jgi:hypothetical protein